LKGYEFDISIVIVNYNVKDYLYQCLLSIRKASENLKIQTIVVDNNSTDNSVESLEPLFEEVKFISLSENLGFSKANNVGFKESKGKYILILNPDTLLQDDTLQTMKIYMDENPDIGISGCKVLNADGSFQLACRRGFPTPWASFTKLFGLQTLFPKSKLFARYNQTFRDIDETYDIDALIGAFMFAKAETIEKLNGFDETFFMYGEDLDLCFRAKEAGFRISYYHKTSIIHFKGESTKRSSINEIKHFYNAMEIFAKKHYSKSYLFFLILKLGIIFRSVLAYLSKQSKDLLFIFFDLIIINSSLIISNKLRFGGYFTFPDYAYPTVFIALSLILIISMIISGEYFENNHKVKNTFFGYLISFFLLSSLTYFFNEYAFSRGILLITNGLAIIGSGSLRIILETYNSIIGKNSKRRVAFLGIDKNFKYLLNSIYESKEKKLIPIGIINTNNSKSTGNDGLNVIGGIDYISKIIKENDLNDIIVLDEKISTKELINLKLQNSSLKVSFHKTSELDEILLNDIINELVGKNAMDDEININKFRNRLFKRMFDIIISILFITILSPFTIIIFKSVKNKFKKLLNVFSGKMSFIGIYKKSNTDKIAWKEGFLSIIHVTGENLNDKNIDDLNDFYLKNFTFSLDFEIFFKFLIRK
jgi:GT2 family glycosyltransferase